MLSQKEQPTLPSSTDIVKASTPIPIFYLHEGEHPFCARPGCICMVNNEQLEALLQGVIGRELKLRQVKSGTIAWEVRGGE